MVDLLKQSLDTVGYLSANRGADIQTYSNDVTPTVLWAMWRSFNERLFTIQNKGVKGTTSGVSSETNIANSIIYDGSLLYNGSEPATATNAWEQTSISLMQRILVGSAVNAALWAGSKLVNYYQVPATSDSYTESELNPDIAENGFVRDIEYNQWFNVRPSVPLPQDSDFVGGDEVIFSSTPEKFFRRVVDIDATTGDYVYAKPGISKKGDMICKPVIDDILFFMSRLCWYYAPDNRGSRFNPSTAWRTIKFSLQEGQTNYVDESGCAGAYAAANSGEITSQSITDGQGIATATISGSLFKQANYGDNDQIVSWNFGAESRMREVQHGGNDWSKKWWPEACDKVVHFVLPTGAGQIPGLSTVDQWKDVLGCRFPYLTPKKLEAGHPLNGLTSYDYDVIASWDKIFTKSALEHFGINCLNVAPFPEWTEANWQSLEAIRFYKMKFYDRVLAETP